jgi:hypothetical protein
MFEVASDRVQGIGKVRVVVSWVYSCMWMIVSFDVVVAVRIWPSQMVRSELRTATYCCGIKVVDGWRCCIMCSYGLVWGVRSLAALGTMSVYSWRRRVYAVAVEDWAAARAMRAKLRASRAALPARVLNVRSCLLKCVAAEWLVWEIWRSARCVSMNLWRKMVWEGW